MKQRSITLHILLWCEMIVAARVLVFTLPVMIKKYSQGSAGFAGVEGWTILALTLIGLYYLATGLASVLKLRGWKLFHYLGTVLTATLIFSLAVKIAEENSSVSLFFFIPVVLSLGLSLAVLLIKDQEKAKS